MIRKLEPIKEFDCSDTPQAKMRHHSYHNDCIKKINELVDAVNELHEEAKNNVRIRANHDSLIESLIIQNNIHEKQIDELQMKVEPEKCETPVDPYAEQRWVGHLCKLWTGDGLVRYGILRGIALNRKKTNYPYQALSTSFEHCEPVKPDDDIIYKGA